MKRYPRYRVFAGSLTDATAKVDLAATYGKVGNAVNIWGYDNMAMLLAEIANNEGGVVKFFLAPSGSQPANSTGMYQLVAAAGTEVEVTVTQNVRHEYSLTGVSGKWLLVEGKGASSTTADLVAFLHAQELLGAYTGQDHEYGRGVGHGLIATNNIPIVATATTLTTDLTDVGLIVDVGGLSNLTLYVTNSGLQTGRINVYYEKSQAAPADTTTMWRLCGTNGAALNFDTLTAEKAAHPLLVSGARWLAIKAAGLTDATDIAVSVCGVAQGG